MEKNPKELLVSKTEIFFNKRDLLRLLSAATDSNIVVVSTKQYAGKNETNVSFQAQPMFLNTVTGKITPEKGGKAIIGAAPFPCPYPPGCDGTQLAEKAKLMSSFLNLKEKTSNDKM